MAGFRPNTSISSFLVGPKWSAWRVTACQVMPSSCIVYSFLPLVEGVGGRFPPVDMVPAVNTRRELLGTPLWRSSHSGHSRKFVKNVSKILHLGDPLGCGWCL